MTIKCVNLTIKSLEIKNKFLSIDNNLIVPQKFQNVTLKLFNLF
jgi:hypothetical protein